MWSYQTGAERLTMGLSPNSKTILDGIEDDLSALEAALGRTPSPTLGLPFTRHEMKKSLILLGINIVCSEGVISDDEVYLIYDIHAYIEKNYILNDNIDEYREELMKWFVANQDACTHSIVPAPVLALDKYDAANGTTLGLVARTMYFRFANAVAKCDREVTTKETEILSALERALFAARVLGQTLTPNSSTPVGASPSSTSSQPRALAEIMTDLNTLIGLQQVKEDVLDLVNFMEVQKLRRARGLRAQPMAHHLVFLGNPGTGKTTVARLLAEVYGAMGMVRKGHLIEVDRSGLVAGYLGQTALRVAGVIEQALGGMLFIDEAYSLTPDSPYDLYGEEAVATLLKAMEDHRDDLIVVVAGYTEKMNDFIESNPGLESRFTKYFSFEDYSPEQLVEICDGFCVKAQYQMGDDAPGLLLSLFSEMHKGRDESFGNARLARTVFERAIENQATRIMGEKGEKDKTAGTLQTIVGADLPTIRDLAPPDSTR